MFDLRALGRDDFSLSPSPFLFSSKEMSPLIAISPIFDLGLHHVMDIVFSLLFLSLSWHRSTTQAKLIDAGMNTMTTKAVAMMILV